MNGTDQDLAAHFTIIRKAGITLYGETADTLFGAVHKADYLDSLRSAEESYGSAEPFSADGGIGLLEDFARSMVTEIFGQ